MTKSITKFNELYIAIIFNTVSLKIINDNSIHKLLVKLNKNGLDVDKWIVRVKAIAVI